MRLSLQVQTTFDLPKAGTEQVRQILTASMAVQIFAACDVRIASRLFTLFLEDLFSLFLNVSTFVHSILAKKKAAAKISPLQSVPTTIETLLHFQGTKYESSCLQNRRLHAKPHWKTRIWTGVAADLVRRARSALSKSTGLERFQTVYQPYFFYESRTLLLHVLPTHADGFLPSSLHRSLNGVQCPATTEVGLDSAAWKRSDAVGRCFCRLCSSPATGMLSFSVAASTLSKLTSF